MYRICFIIIHNLLSVTFVQNLLEIFFKNITLKKDANEKKLHLFKKTQNKKKAGLTSFHKNENSADIGSRNRPVKGIFHMMKLNTKVTRSISSQNLSNHHSFIHFGLADCCEFMACLASSCQCSQNINKYSNKSTKRYKRIIRRF